MSEYVKDASIFAQHIIIALDCLEEARAMQSIFLQKKYESQYKIAPHFYSTAYHALLFRCQVEIAKLFDETGKAYSFKQFKNNVKRVKKVKQEDIEEYKAKKEIASKDLQAIENRRNQALAHSDKKYFNNPKELFDNESVNFDTIKELLLTMLKICNRVIFDSSESGPANLYSTYNGDDFVKLFGVKTWYEHDVERHLNATR